MVRAPDGLEWLRAADVAARLPGVSVGLVKVWVHRGRVASMRVGRQRWVCWQDCLLQERATRAHRGGGQHGRARV